MSRPPQLVLIDGHALAFRAFHALREAGLRTSSGEPTYAVFGFAQIMLTMIQEQQPEYVAVSFDVGRTFRDDLYADYKAGRTETPEEFHPQLDRIQQLVRTLNIPIYTADGYEADDVIGTLARQATAQGIGTIILTGDTDTLQLVDEHVRVLLANPYGKQTTTTMYDDERVVERYKGLRPAQLADLRGLKGDVSDNIPGVKGIGETGAIQLLMQYETVENLYDHLDEVPSRYRKALDGQREQALFSKRLATIVCDAPVHLDLAVARLGDYDRAAVIALFQELEIGASSNLIKKLPASGAFEAQPLPTGNTPAQQDMFAPPSPPSGVEIDAATHQLAMFDVAAVAPLAAPVGALGNYRAITEEAALDVLISELNAAPAFAFDTEASGLRPFESDLVGISIAVHPGSAFYLPVGHRDGPQLPRQYVLDALRPYFSDTERPKYAHNAKFDIEMLLSAGVPVRGLTFDTMIAAGLLNKRMGLKDLAFYELKLPEPMTPIEDLIGRGSKQITFDAVPIAQATPYAAADADMTLRLVLALQPQLAALENIHQIFQRLEMPLVPVLVDMEQAGITLNADYIRSLGSLLGERIAALEAAIYEVAGKRFNINSGQQLNEVLFERLQLPTAGLSRLKSGGYSITAEVLEQFSEQYPIARLILEYRQLGKLKSTYIDALPQMVNPHTRRVHTVYNQMGAATGRLSSNDPNLQNIPVRTEEGRAIRRGFVAAEGCTLVAADYSQIELRVLAHVTGDENLIGVFQRDEDIHAATAAQLFGVPQNEVSKNQRRVAKCVAAGTLVTTERGILPIEQLGTVEPGELDELGCLVAQEGRQRQLATGFYNGGVQPTIRITTERGYVLEATAQHKVRSLDIDGSYIWRELGNLQPGDYVALARGAMLFGQDRPFDFVPTRRNDKQYDLPERLNPLFARFLGYVVSEGNIRRSQGSLSVVISNIDPKVINDLRDISERLFGREPKALIDKNGVTRLSWHCSELADLLQYLGVGADAANKRIPDCVMQGSYASAAAFLSAYFEGAGSVSDSFISAGSKSEQLIRQLQTLLLNFGIVSYLEQWDIPDYGRHYKLRLIGRESRAIFARHIGFISIRKRRRLIALLERRLTSEAIQLPRQVARLTRMHPQTKRELKQAIQSCIRTKSQTVGLTYRRLGRILDQFPQPSDPDAQALREHQQRNLFYDTIQSIELCQRQVYDLVVPVNHTYLANGFVSHNTVVFGVAYGISAFGLAPRINASRAEAQALIDALFARFPGIRRYIDDTLARGRRDGYVESLFGRRRAMPDLKASGPRRAAAEREAINAPIQATAADIMKMAMIGVYAALRERDLKTRMLLQVHDEIILEAPADESATVSALLKDVMENVYELKVPLRANVESGTTWDDMHDT